VRFLQKGRGRRLEGEKMKGGQNGDVYDFMLSIGGWVWQTGSGPLCIYAFLANENVKLYQEI
jgi:hypothetical protein